MELLGLAVLLVFALAIVIIATRGLFARDLTRALKRVTQQEQELQEQADILEQRLNQLERDYHAKLKSADAEAARIIQEAKNQAMNIRTAAIEEAKHRARQLLLEAEQGKAHLKAMAAKELNGASAQRACESLRTLLPPAGLTALHSALTTELLEALKHVNVQSVRDGVEHVEMVTALPLAVAESQRLAQWVATSVGAQVPIQTETNPALVAGCIVRVGATIIDNSLVNRLGQER